MGKWLAAAVAALIGLALLKDYPVVGLALMAPLPLLVFFSFRGSRPAPPPVRPMQLQQARYDSRAEIAAAERRARRAIAQARKQAEREGQRAVTRAEQRLAAEPRWV